CTPTATPIATSTTTPTRTPTKTPASTADLDIVMTDVSPVFGPESTGATNGNWRSTVRYALFDDGPAPIALVFIQFLLTNAGNTSSSFGNFAINGVAQNPNGDPTNFHMVDGWECTTSSPSVTVSDFSVYNCVGSLAADPGTPHDN